MVDLQVSVTDVDVSIGVEVVGGLQPIGSKAGPGVGALRGDEVRREGLSQGGIAGADEHSKQVTGMARSPNTSSLQWPFAGSIGALGIPTGSITVNRASINTWVAAVCAGDIPTV